MGSGIKHSRFLLPCPNLIGGRIEKKPRGKKISGERLDVVPQLNVTRDEIP